MLRNHPKHTSKGSLHRGAFLAMHLRRSPVEKEIVPLKHSGKSPNRAWFSSRGLKMSIFNKNRTSESIVYIRTRAQILHEQGNNALRILG